MSAARSDRQEAIRAIVREEGARTQNELVEALREQGYEVTQATVSRDIADLALEKDPRGFYALAEDIRLRRLASTMVVDTRRAGNQVVVKTEPGAAQSVAAALDASDAPGTLGSIAGDDTILVITADEECGKRFQSELNKMFESR